MTSAAFLNSHVNMTGVLNYAGARQNRLRKCSAFVGLCMLAGCASKGESLNTGNGKSFEVLLLRHEVNDAKGAYSRFHEQLRARYVTASKDSSTLASDAATIFRSLAGFAILASDSMVVVESARPMITARLPLYLFIRARFVRQPDGSWLELGMGS